MSAISAIASHLASASHSPSLDRMQAMDVAESGGKESFAQMLDRQVSGVNDLLSISDKKTTEMAMGKTENLHDAMISIEKAESAFKFMVQLRNKAMEAYNEIIRMQV